MKFTSAIALAILQAILPFMASAASADAEAYKLFCCDAIAPAITPEGKIGSERSVYTELCMQGLMKIRTRLLVNCSASLVSACCADIVRDVPCYYISLQC